MPTARTIDEVIYHLDEIIEDATRTRNRLGYFPALYRKVTVKVKEGIAAGRFEDGPRMERLDVRFANRYLETYDAFHAGGPITQSWRLAFDTGSHWWPIVLQHLLLGMNAHINLDLGIAAAETAPGDQLPALRRDFNTINDILHDLIDEVQEELAEVWPLLRRLDLVAGDLDELLSRFGIDLSRDKAWAVAGELAALPPEQHSAVITRVDQRVADFGRKVLGPPKFWFRAGLLLVRLGELQAVDRIIGILR